ncbi:MAG: NHL repeat-containing [Geobacteraceae bacterium]|nr:MAG: NHL repeat-containing [Geobacteraceae bacterium]
MLPRFLFALIFIVISGCAAVEPVPFRDNKVDAVWPAPPNQPRVRFLREIKGPDEIIPAKGKVQRFVDLVTGEKRSMMEFATPYGIITNGDFVIYVADPSAGVVHRYDLAKRDVTYIVQAGEEFLTSPVGVALDREENLYVSDSVNAKVYKFNNSGEFIRELKGTEDFQRPAGIAINSRSEKFVVDVLAQKLYVFDKDDGFVRDFPKVQSGEEMNSPSNVAIDHLDNVYVTDSMNFMVRVYDHEGNLKNNVGGIGDVPGFFARPKGVALDSNQHIYVVDANHDNFQIFDQEGRLLLFIGKNGVGPGEFYLPSGICIDKHDRIFITDTFNHRIQIFQYLKEGGKQ